MPAWKDSERRTAAKLQKAAGRVEDPQLEAMVTDTGRVGHLTSLGFDILVGNGPTGICGEAKRRKNSLTKEMLGALKQIVGIARNFKRTPVLVLSLTQEQAPERSIPRDWVLVPLDFFCEAVEALALSEHNQEKRNGVATRKRR